MSANVLTDEFCRTCRNTGIVARGLDGEPLYCEECEVGIRMALDVVLEAMSKDSAWLAWAEAAAKLGKFVDRGVYEQTQYAFKAEVFEHDRLVELLP